MSLSRYTHYINGWSFQATLLNLPRKAIKCFEVFKSRDQTWYYSARRSTAAAYRYAAPLRTMKASVLYLSLCCLKQNLIARMRRLTVGLTKCWLSLLKKQSFWHASTGCFVLSVALMHYTSRT